MELIQYDNCRLSPLIAYPTESPTGCWIKLDIRCAADLVATRLGSTTITLLFAFVVLFEPSFDDDRGEEATNNGIIVVFPAPGAASRSKFGFVRIDSLTESKMPFIGENAISFVGASGENSTITTMSSLRDRIIIIYHFCLSVCGLEWRDGSGNQSHLLHCFIVHRFQLLEGAKVQDRYDR
eukprot:scaffold4576_cov128-Skeletonema_menzelii.AAC.4